MEIRNPSQHLKTIPKIYPGFETGNESFSFCIKNMLQDLFQEGLHRLFVVSLYRLCRVLGFLQVFNLYPAVLATEISKSGQRICTSHPYEVEDIAGKVR